MTENEKIEKLCEKAHVTEEVAKDALVRSDWDLLDAILLLEREGKTEGETARHSTKAEAAEEVEDDDSRFKAKAHDVWAQIKRWIQIGNENSFVFTWKNKRVLALPVTAMVILFLFSHLWMLVLLAIGLFCGMRYSLEGEQLGKPQVNDVMDKAANAAENVRETVGDSFRKGNQ